ncbi:MAG: thioesterase [Gammaproteobacteria bacterium]|nr:MAG: thioesterase [Gammaproteobacteria bacterium]
MKNKPVFFIPRENLSRTTRLICFPFAGGNATFFYSWLDLLPKNIELVAIQLPGRGMRLGEQHFISMSEMADEIASQIAPHTADCDYMFFGHSMGAPLAYEVTCRLSRPNIRLPQKLILSSSIPPHKINISERFSNDASFIENIISYGGIPKEIQQNKEMLDFFLPSLKCDFEILKQYRNVTKKQILTDIEFCYAEDDCSLQTEYLSEWQKYTKGNFNCTKFSGGHFFIESKKESFLKHLNKILT